MAADKDTSALTASSMGAIIALVIGVVVVQQLPLEKLRPDESEKSRFQIVDLQDATARLWQDPFAAVEQHQDELEKALRDQPQNKGKLAQAHLERHGRDAVRTQIGYPFPPAKGKRGKRPATDAAPAKMPLSIVAVMVPGGAQQEDAEQRRRYRYAVIAALNVVYFAPEDENHVGYVIGAPGIPDRHESRKAKGSSDDGKCDTSILPEKIPFESFVRIKEPDPKEKPDPTKKPDPEKLTRGSKVLVLWLNERAFATTPVKKLRNVISCLGLEPSTSATPPEINLLGPVQSQTLVNMLVEAKAAESKPQNKLPEITIYSALATAAECLLYDTAINQPPVPPCTSFAPDILGKKLEPLAVRFLRTIGGDDALAHALVDELELRGVKRNAGKSDRIVLISESDTFYGRTLPQSIIYEYCPASPPCERVIRLSYFRGTDGALSGDSTPNSGGAGSAPSREIISKNQEAARAEHADGRHQFDYIRRLADRIKSLKNDGNRITAVGVLGSDVYDKLLVLKALRAEFPEAEFFTTDLDARLLHPEEFRWARNLIVASNFGLELHPKLQWDAPPFRDGYQTSLFFATLLALDVGRSGFKQSQINEKRQARLYEIGRRNAYSLDIDKDADTGTCSRFNVGLCRTVHPQRASFVHPLLSAWKFYWAVIPILLLIWLFLYPKFAHHRNFTPQQPQSTSAGRLEVALHQLEGRKLRAIKYFVLSTILLFLLLHVGGVMLLNSSANAEPVALHEGISVWPAELVRLAAGWLSLFLIYWGGLRLEKNSLELTRWYFRGEGSAPRRVSWPGWSRKTLKAIFACDLLGSQNALTPLHRIDAAELWRQFDFHGLARARWIRTAVPALLFYVFGLLLSWALRFPHTPYRGGLSQGVDIAMAFWSALIFLLLTFFVVDATVLCVRLIRVLSDHHTSWPDETREHYGLRRRKDPPGAFDDYEIYDDWIDMRFIAERTAVVGRLVYYPFGVLVLLLFARSELFDKWDWPVGVVLPSAIGLIILIACAVGLRQEVERARQIALAKAARKLLVLKGAIPARPDLVSQLELTIRNIESIREGAFVPITQQPVVKAMLFFLSASGLAVLAYFGVFSL